MMYTWTTDPSRWLLFAGLVVGLLVLAFISEAFSKRK